MRDGGLGPPLPLLLYNFNPDLKGQDQEACFVAGLTVAQIR